MPKRYYQPDAETMPVNEIKKLQEYKLIHQVRKKDSRQPLHNRMQT